MENAMKWKTWLWDCPLCNGQRGKQKCGEFTSVECAPLQVANLPQRNTHTDWRRRERIFFALWYKTRACFLHSSLGYMYASRWRIKIIIGSIPTFLPAKVNKCSQKTEWMRAKERRNVRERGTKPVSMWWKKNNSRTRGVLIEIPLYEGTFYWTHFNLWPWYFPEPVGKYKLLL